MNKKTIKIKFIDFWKGFNIQESIFYHILSEHYEIEICDNANYIIYSCFGDQILNEPDNTIKIFYSGENEAPNFNICDYAMSFEHLSLGDRYFRLPVYYVTDFYKKETLLMEHKHENISDIVSSEKSQFCSFVVSNARGATERQQMFEQLNNYKKVNSGGKYLNNIGTPIKDKLEFESKHKFSICFDNCQYRGYTTEKIVEAFAARTIPIYWGDPEITKIFNPKAFINVMEYPSIDAAIEYIKEIDQNDDLYLSIIQEPALLNEADSYDNTYNRLSKWIQNIMDQPFEQARRTGNGFWHTEYYWRMRNYKRATEHPISIIKDKLLKKLKF
jgi:hypothetical protein